MLTSRIRPRLAAMIMGAVLLSGATDSFSRVSVDDRCHSYRLKAAGLYAKCVQAAMEGLYKTQYDESLYRAAVGKCVTNYAAWWPALQAWATNAAASEPPYRTLSQCEKPRFDTTVPGTVIDRLTGLQWEQKVDPSGLSDPHLVGNTYTWSNFAPLANGTAFTSFLAALNTGACFAAHCDWRLPTRDELLTIATATYPSCAGPCIDPAFGPTSAMYWSATSEVMRPHEAWFVSFAYGFASHIGKSSTLSVRAVRTQGLCHLENAEVCNGLDEDCDGEIDEGLSGKLEICNGEDEDCDGLVDEDAPCPEGQSCVEAGGYAYCR